MEKSKLYLLTSVLFIGGFALLHFTGNTNTTIAFNKTKFTVPDANALDRITMNSQDRELSFSQVNNDWYVNDSILMDRSLRMVFFRMMSELQVRRPIASNSRSAVKKDLEENGTLVNFYQQGEGLLSFYVNTNNNQGKTYFSSANEKEVYLMEIPGYQQNISAIFNLTALQWKDRKIFETQWQSLSSLKINYSAEAKEDLVISYKDRFPEIDGIEMARVDSARLIGYLDLYAYFETNEHIHLPDYERLDSLSQVEPEAVIDVTDVDISRNNTLTVFPQLPQSTVRLVQEKSGDWSVIETNRIIQLLATPNDFIRPQNGKNL